MRRWTTLLAAAGVAAAAGGVALVATPANAATGCAATYTVVSQWSDGFQGSVTVTNLGTAVSSWTIGFTFPTANQKVTQGWNGTWSQSGTSVTVTNESWNGALGLNASVSPGFLASWSGANPAPTSFTLNGNTCTGTLTSATPSTASPTASTASPTASSASPTPSSSGGTGGSVAPALHVSGNHLVTAAGATYRMLGVNRSSGEFACVQGKGMWDSGPVDQASVDAMKTWNIHTVRIPLNEECWLGTNGTPSGATYQQAVKDYVDLLVANGITPIVEMHWNYGVYTGNGSACSDATATCQKAMPDAQYAPNFWTVATMFKGNNAVVFDLFNEPYPDAAANWDATAAWTCWRDGGTCTGIGYQVAGMQTLVNTVRATGATNVVMLGGVAWSNDLSQWLTYKPTDSTGNLMAAWHVYNFNSCSNTSCWDSQVATVAAQVPVMAGEIGQNSCAHDFIDQVMTWADTHGVGYAAWTWNPWGVCSSSGNDLITDWAGTATSTFGEGFKAHLLTVNP
jgi:endoglucanase